MNDFIEILKITLPAVLVLLATYLTMKRFFTQPSPDISDKSKAIRLKAYERLTLYLERISPDKLLQRTQTNKMNCAELQMALLKTIRQEYEHNLTQQLYVSDEAWDSILIAKEAINQLINSSMTAVNKNTPAINLTKIIIETYQGTTSNPVELSIRMLKSEVSKLLK